MRKSLILFLFLTVLLFGGTCYIHADLISVKDQVSYQESISYGDPSITEGIAVKNNVQFDQKLFWNTTYTAGVSPKTTTDYQFHAVNQPAEFKNYDFFQIDSFWDGYSSSSDNYPQIFEDLAKETEPGEVNYKKIYLKDYYDYYPISCDIQIGDYYHSGWDAFYLEGNDNVENETIEHVKAFNEFLKIPLVEKHSMEIEVGKNLSGKVNYTSSSTTDEEAFQFSTWSVVTKDAIYFTFDSHTTEGNVVDTSHIPGGYGIYRLPYRIKEGTNTFNIDTDQLVMAYPLDPENTISSMLLTKDGSKILLFCTDEANTGSQLMVIEESTMETSQIIPVPGIPLDDNVTEILHVSDHFLYDDFVGYSCSGDYILLFPIQEDGSLELAFVHKVYPDPSFYYWIHAESAMDWNGERLAVASPNGFCDFALAVYDKTGLLYFGNYVSSLGKGGHSFHHGYIMNQDAKEPYLQVEWKN